MIKLKKYSKAIEKSHRGIVLSGADIEQLLKDPTSWVSKLFADCQLEAAISRAAFIGFLEIAMQEQALELASRKETAADLAARAAKEEFYFELEQQQRAKNYQTDVLVDALSPLKVLKLELAALLPLSQQSMSRAQLINHHRRLTNSFNHQVLAALGPNIEVPFKVGDRTVKIALTVPATITPTLSAAEILDRSPVLAHSLRERPEERDGFAKVATLSSIGHLATIKTVGQILDANTIVLEKIRESLQGNIIISASELLKMVDKAIINCRNENLPLIDALEVNNQLSIARSMNKNLNAKTDAFINQVKPTLTNHPAFFSNPFQLKLQNARNFKVRKWEQDGNAWVSPSSLKRIP